MDGWTNKVLTFCLFSGGTTFTIGILYNLSFLAYVTFSFSQNSLLVPTFLPFLVMFYGSPDLNVLVSSSSSYSRCLLV